MYESYFTDKRTPRYMEWDTQQLLPDYQGSSRLPRTDIYHSVYPYVYKNISSRRVYESQPRKRRIEKMNGRRNKEKERKKKHKVYLNKSAVSSCKVSYILRTAHG